MIIVPRAAIREAIRHDATAMASLVGSLADNKAALGRRYAEWAVSAPTLESAVAAAAMAQDELGHARSTYPVLKALGAEATTTARGRRAPAGAARRRAARLDRVRRRQPARRRRADHVRRRLRRQLDDAAGPARAQDPPGGGLAPRARRGVGAAAVPRRASATRCSPAATRRGPRPAAGWAGRRSRLPRGARGRMVAATPAVQREQVRAWLADLLGAKTSVTLEEPADWSGWDPSGAGAVGAATCPFCDAPEAERVGQWGGQIITSPVALPGLRLLLRGGARGLRRYAAGRRLAPSEPRSSPAPSPCQSAWRSSKTSCARSRGHAARQHGLRQVGVEERELAPRVHEQRLGAEHRLGRRRAAGGRSPR